MAFVCRQMAVLVVCNNNIGQYDNNKGLIDINPVFLLHTSPDASVLTNLNTILLLNSTCTCSPLGRRGGGAWSQLYPDVCVEK